MDKKFDHEQNQLARQNELLCKAREQAEQARLEAAEANKYMMLMLDATPLCCELWDANFNIIDCNSATVNFFNLNSKKEYMKRFCEFLPEYQPNGERSEEKIANCIQKALNEGSYSCEWTHMLSGGTLVPVEATFVPVINGKEMVTAIYFRDLRNDKAAERRMQESMERERNLEIQKQAAQAASNAKTQFLASMSHEIRTPMNAIIGMSDLLLSEDLNIRQHRYAEDIRISALALLAIINDILDLSKIQAAKLSLIPVHFLFEPLIDYISSMIIFLIKDNCKEDLDFHVNMPSEYPECLYGDDVRFRQILINVLGNAVKFTKAGSITLDINFKDEKMLISVTDTGIGIPKKDLPNLFDAFEQVDSQKNRHHQGTGLGLSITKSLVELMGGRISVESAYGEGSTFLIELPVVLGDKNLIRHEETTFEIVYAPQANVLVVDDRETNLNVVCGLLHHCKINADKALSGPIAIDKAHQKKYDLIFMDHMMPEMDGVDTTKVLRDMGLTIPIIALTANAVSGARELLISSGMDDFLSKPIDKSELYRILKEWLPPNKLLSAAKAKAMDNNFAEILNGDGTERKPYQDSEKKFWKAIDKIEGLSVVLGTDIAAGQLDIYKHTLEIATIEFEKTIDNLLYFLAVNDLDGFRTEVHGIKGSLALIGATPLSGKALKLENAAAAQDADFCNLNLPDLLHGLKDLSDKLKAAFSDLRKNQESSELPDEIKIVLEKIRVGIADEDFMVLWDEIAKLEAFLLTEPVNGDIADLIEAVQIMNYGFAKVIIDRLLSS